VKPDPVIFLSVCTQAGCKPTELLHVGDSLETDVAGANNVGAVSVWLNRKDCENPGRIQPTHEIRSIAELPSIAEAYGKVV
jgi:putative hydrolase of the HAD superfamily